MLVRSIVRRAGADLLRLYSETALRRVWRAEQFSWWMTVLLHRFADADVFQHRLQLAQLDYLTASKAAAPCGTRSAHATSAPSPISGDFVRFAQTQNLGLDLTNPPKRR